MELRASDREWIDAVCHELSRMTGWPTLFAPLPAEDEAASCNPRLAETFSWRCEITDGDRRFGILGVAVPSGRTLDDSFLHACEVADLVAQLLQRVLAEQSAAADWRTAIPAPSESVSDDSCSEGDPWTLAVNRLLDVSLRVTELRAAALAIADPEHDSFRLRALRTRDRQSPLCINRPLSECPLDARSLCREPVVIRRSDRQFSEWLPDGMSLGICYGIAAGERLGGMLWVFDRRDRRLTPREHQALQSIVSRLSGLIERAVLVEESALQRVLRSELRIASESQTAPSMNIEPLGGWCQVTTRLESYREVGGDLCEVIPLDEDRILLAVGDAAGHSLPAAMIMATVRGALRVIAQDPEDPDLLPEQIVTRLNRVLHGVVESYQFMTLACAVFDRRRQTIRLANAGHPPVLLFREGAVHRPGRSGLLLGIMDDALYDSRVVELEPGDLLVFYTDGVTEARDERQQLFQQEGIINVVRRHADESADEITTHIWNALQAHLAADDHDDRTLLVIRIGGQTGESTGECGRFVSCDSSTDVLIPTSVN